MIRQIDNREEKAKVTESILRSLPDWFGIEESTKEYIENSRDCIVFAYSEDEVVSGFIALKETSKFTLELYVCGVLVDYHRKGIGRALFDACFDFGKEQGYEFMQVKTVRKGIYDIYDRTNKFYESLGFKEFECLSELWGAENPCQIYVMNVR